MNGCTGILTLVNDKKTTHDFTRWELNSVLFCTFIILMCYYDSIVVNYSLWFKN